MKTARFWMAAMMLGAALLGLASAAHAKTNDQAAITKLLNDLGAAVGAKDMDRIMSFYVPDESLFVFDSIPPRQYVGAKAWRKDFEGFFAEYPGPIKFEVGDLSVTTDGQLAFAHYVAHMTGAAKDGTSPSSRTGFRFAPPRGHSLDGGLRSAGCDPSQAGDVTRRFISSHLRAKMGQHLPTSGVGNDQVHPRDVAPPRLGEGALPRDSCGFSGRWDPAWRCLVAKCFKGDNCDEEKPRKTSKYA